MENTKQKLEQFFDEYAARTNRALGDEPVVDVDATSAAFATTFLEASPKGVSCGNNDDEFRKAIPKGLEFYRSIGTKSMNIITKNMTQLDDFHWMVKVHWEAHYQKSDGAKNVIPFEVIYMTQVIDEAIKIFCYITGDEEQMYKDHGLVPE